VWKERSKRERRVEEKGKCFTLVVLAGSDGGIKGLENRKESKEKTD
jgi:hypothetical protein